MLTMWELFHHPLREEEWFGILFAILLVGVIGSHVLRVVLAHARSSREHDAAVALKMEMIQRGMSAGDIERVLAAKIDGPVPTPPLAARAGRAAGEALRRAFS
jgi:hypothetical protein